MKMGKKRKKERKDTWVLLNAAYEKKKSKKERLFFLNRQYIDWRKRRKENWTFLNCDCNIVLTCCKVKLFEFVSV